MELYVLESILLTLGFFPVKMGISWQLNEGKNHSFYFFFPVSLRFSLWKSLANETLFSAQQTHDSVLKLKERSSGAIHFQRKSSILAQTFLDSLH